MGVPSLFHAGYFPDCVSATIVDETVISYIIEGEIHASGNKILLMPQI